MSTGHASWSRRARSASPRTESSISTSMNVPGIRRSSSGGGVDSRGGPLAEALADELGDLRDLLGDGDAGVLEARDLLGRRAGAALDDRPGVAEAHARHLVHEAARH